MERSADAIAGLRSPALAIARSFVRQNRIRQAASSPGAALYYIEESVRYARIRMPFGGALAKNRAIRFPRVEPWRGGSRP